MSTKDIIFIKGIKIKTYLGIHIQEKLHKQIIILDLEISTDAKIAARTDQIEDALNYQEIYHKVIDFVKTTKFQLIETLAENIATFILDNFNTNHIKLSIFKPKALHPAIAGIIIERTKDTMPIL